MARSLCVVSTGDSPTPQFIFGERSSSAVSSTSWLQLHLTARFEGHLPGSSVPNFAIYDVAAVVVPTSPGSPSPARCEVVATVTPTTTVS